MRALATIRAISAALTASVLVTVLASCSSSGPSPGLAQSSESAVIHVPAQKQLVPGEGILLGQLAGAAIAANYHERLWFRSAVIKIRDSAGKSVSYVGAVNDGTVEVPLKAGDYVVESVETQRFANDKTLRAYPLDLNVQVVAGRATNLGLIALVRSTDGKKDNFLRVLIDDTREASARLRKEQPELFAALDAQLPVVPAFDAKKYAAPEGIEALRREIARDAFTRTDGDADATYVSGEVGTLAKVIRDSKGRPVGYEALQTDSLARMFSCAGEGERFVCSSSEPALYLVKGASVQKLALPSESRFWWVNSFPPAGIAVVDENMSIYRSSDDGRTWNKSAWFAPKKPLVATTRIKSYNGKSGFYFYDIDKIDPIAPRVIYSEYTKDSYRPITIPDMAVWDSLVETGEGIAVGPVYANEKPQSVFYVRAARGDRWEERPLPDVSCLALHRSSASSDLTILCSHKRYRSHDQGRTWTLDVAG